MDLKAKKQQHTVKDVRDLKKKDEKLLTTFNEFC